MQKLRWLGILMGITIIGITAFQLYWLKNNYTREKQNLEIKTNVAFKETLFELQASYLHLGKPNADSLKRPPVRFFVSDRNDSKLQVSPGTEVVEMVNILRDKVRDSVQTDSAGQKSIVISMNNSAAWYRNDSPSGHHVRVNGDPGDKVFQFLYDMDSLQDSIKLKNVVEAYSKRLKKEKLAVSFDVTRTETGSRENKPTMNEVVLGFSKPVAYRLHLLNIFSYVIRKIAWPVLFSLFLITVTVLSFVLLYRNLIRQRKLAELKNEFISNITHELKTPIATVGVAIEALKNFNAIHDPQRTREYLDISQNELQRLSLLVDKVLKLSMFENKKIELKKEPFDLKELVEETMNIMKLQFEKHKAKVSLQTEGDNFMIEADRLHITSVLYNLLDNALKYSQENPVIDVQLTAQPEFIEFSVKDNGIGISPAYQQKIFDKFFRVPTGDKHNTKGYGLGLSYVSEVIKRHHGNIFVESELGKGSTFTAKLPYV